MVNNIDGFDDFANELRKLQNEVEKIGEMDGERISFGELFPPSFMKKYTDVVNIDEFLDNSPWEIESQKDFEEIPETEMDRYVDNHSRFRTWEQMKSEAGNELVKRKLDI